jgi:hypothetical protein
MWSIREQSLPLHNIGCEVQSRLLFDRISIISARSRRFACKSGIPRVERQSLRSIQLAAQSAISLSVSERRVENVGEPNAGFL